MMTKRAGLTMVGAIVLGSFTGGGVAVASTVSAIPTTDSFTRSTVNYVAAPGEANRLTVHWNGDGAMFEDASAVITAGPGCQSVSAHQATCATPNFYADVDVALDDGHDTGTLAGPLLAGEEDTLIGAVEELGRVLFPGPLDAPSGLSLSLAGGAGNDVLRNENGAYSAFMSGGPGDDQLVGNNQDRDGFDGGSGADTIQGGGGGRDKVLYRDRTSDVSVSLDGVANDGEAGERDNVAADLEEVETGSGNDTIVGTNAGNDLDGNAGNDRIYGRGGNDYVYGGPGNDTLDGGEADDSIVDGDGDDLVLGGNGHDRFAPHEGSIDVTPPELGSDRYVGGGGQDQLDYSEEPAGVRVDFDRVADDGRAGEGDNVFPDVEIVAGSRYDDVLTGDDGSNWLRGGGGSDRLIGGKGTDILYTGSGQSFADGGIGSDVILSYAAADTVRCGAGVDILGSETLHPADCEIIDPTRQVALAITDACSSPLRCMARLDQLLKR